MPERKFILRENSIGNVKLETPQNILPTILPPRDYKRF